MRQFYQLPANALLLMKLRAFLSSLACLLLFVVIGFLIKTTMETDFSWLVVIGLSIFLWIITLFIYLFLTKLEYSYTAFYLGTDGLIIRKGMLWRSETFVLRSRVQHIDVTQDPMSRLFELATIKVYTAGTKLGSITLSGLNHETAQIIRNQLITQMTDTL